MGRLLRRPRRRVRPHHRGDRSQLRLRRAPRHHLRHPGPGHLHGRAQPPHLARRPRPAPHSGDRPDARLPALAPLAPRQPTPGAGHPPHPPRRDDGRPQRRRDLGTGLGDPALTGSPVFLVAATAERTAFRRVAGTGRTVASRGVAAFLCCPPRCPIRTRGRGPEPAVEARARAGERTFRPPHAST
ncbi:hypothetical protein SCOCK_150045 [Actinacidiphila cocklensis]|uniref:Uncharacterized protein n=1 Tax=Actinacidiphila cocklensis TaxID=887465 RepID=A0A9W4DLY4_9ACTN|nr:hypothetical protein SCOCK_150045 [Actinacidiphila cocklensis]